MTKYRFSHTLTSQVPVYVMFVENINKQVTFMVFYKNEMMHSRVKKACQM
jgi:hypothetical protein